MSAMVKSITSHVVVTLSLDGWSPHPDDHPDVPLFLVGQVICTTEDNGVETIGKVVSWDLASRRLVMDVEQRR